MKKLIILFVFMLCLGISNKAVAQSFTYVENSVPVSTQSANGRYKFIQSTNNNAHSFLLDKFAGKVWRYRVGKKEFDEIQREQVDSVNVNMLNYQMYISAENNSMCFLLNIHTGEMWRYASNDGEKIFKKISMPWNGKDK